VWNAFAMLKPNTFFMLETLLISMDHDRWFTGKQA